MMVDHDGWYNPWDELKKPEVKAAYDEAVATGGGAFRTGVYDLSTGMHYGDGLQIYRFGPLSEAKTIEGKSRRVDS